MIAGVLRVSIGLHKQILVVEFDYEHYPFIMVKYLSIFRLYARTLEAKCWLFPLIIST